MVNLLKKLNVNKMNTYEYNQHFTSMPIPSIVNNNCDTYDDHYTELMVRGFICLWPNKIVNTQQN